MTNFKNHRGIAAISSLSSIALALAAGGLAQIALAAEASPQQATRRSFDKRPNVLVWMLDDVVFAQMSCYGGLVATPNIDRVAREGIRYSDLHTTPICSSRQAASLRRPSGSSRLMPMRQLLGMADET
jgi:arylsulfatase